MARNIHSRFKKLVLAVGVILLAFLLFSFFIDSTVVVRKEITVNAPREKILLAVYDLKSWEEWSVWNKEYYQSKDLDYQSMDADTNIYNRLKIISKSNTFVGDDAGEMNITSKQLNNSEVEISYLLKENNFKVTSKFKVMDEEPTKIIWQYEGDYSPLIGLNPLRKYFLYFTKSSLEDAYEKSLLGLKEYLEN